MIKEMNTKLVLVRSRKLTGVRGDMSVAEGSCFLRQNSFLAIDRTAILPRACMSNPLRHCVEVCIRQYTPRERREKGKKTFTQPSPVLHNSVWHMTPRWDGFKTPLQLHMSARYMCCGTCLQLVECSCIFAFLVVSSAFDVSCHLCVQQKWLTDWQADRQTNSMEQSPSTARTFVIVFTNVAHLSLPWTRWIQSTPCHLISLRSILNINLPAAPRFSKWSRLRFTHQNPRCVLGLWEKCYSEKFHNSWSSL